MYQPKQSLAPNFVGPEDAPKCEISLSLNQWETVRGDVVAETDGLGPCVGIVCLNRRAQVAVVGHLAEWVDLSCPTSGGQLDLFLTYCSDQLGKMAGVEIYVGGGENTPGEGYQSDHTAILAAIKKFGVIDRNLYVKWCQPGYIQSIIVNPAVGEVTYVEIRMDEYANDVAVLFDTGNGPSENN